MKPGVVSDMALVLEALCGCRTDDGEVKVCASSEKGLLTTITSLPMSKQRLAFSSPLYQQWFQLRRGKILENLTSDGEMSDEDNVTRLE